MKTHLFNGFTRLGNFPVDSTSLHDSYEDALNYAQNNPTAYYGQILAVVNKTGDNAEFHSVDIYVINKQADEFGVFSKGITPIRGEGGGGGLGHLVINNKEPNEDGYLTLYLSDIGLDSQDGRTLKGLGLTDLLSYLDNVDEDVYKFDKTISTNRILIDGTPEELQDGVNLEFLNMTLDGIVETSTRTIEIPFDSQGFLLYDFETERHDSEIQRFRPGVTVTDAMIIIDEEFEPIDITITMTEGNPNQEDETEYILFTPDMIFETVRGNYYSEIHVQIKEVTTKVGIKLEGSSQTGSGRLVLSYVNKVNNN